MSTSLKKLAPVVGALALAASFTANAGSYVSGTVPNGLFSTFAYKLWVPSGYVSGTAIPIVVALHGCQQTNSDFAKLAKLTAKADANNFFVLLPQKANNGCWNHESSYTRDTGDGKLIMATLAKIKTSYTVAQNRQYVWGLSAGGSMAANLAGCYADQFAAVAVMAGTMYKAATSAMDNFTVAMSGSSYDPNLRGKEAWQCSGSVVGRKVPAIYFHGDADTTLAPKNAEQGVQQWLQTNDYADDGADNNTIPYVATSSQTLTVPITNGRQYVDTQYNYGGSVIVRKILVKGVGHKYGGGDPAVSGADTTSPSYTDMAWDFVKTRTR